MTRASALAARRGGLALRPVERADGGGDQCARAGPRRLAWEAYEAQSVSCRPFPVAIFPGGHAAAAPSVPRPLRRFAPALPGDRKRSPEVTARRRRGFRPARPFGDRRGRHGRVDHQRFSEAYGRGRARGSSFAKRLLALSDRRRRRELDARVRPWHRGRGDCRRGLRGGAISKGTACASRAAAAGVRRLMRSIGILSPISGCGRRGANFWLRGTSRPSVRASG